MAPPAPVVHVGGGRAKRPRKTISVVESFGSPPQTDLPQGRGSELSTIIPLEEVRDGGGAITKFYRGTDDQGGDIQTLYAMFFSLKEKLKEKRKAKLKEKLKEELRQAQPGSSYRLEQQYLEVREELQSLEVREEQERDPLGDLMRLEYYHILIRRMFEHWAQTASAKVTLKKAAKLLQKLYHDAGLFQPSTSFLYEVKQQLKASKRSEGTKNAVMPLKRLGFIREAVEGAFGNALEGSGFTSVLELYLAANTAVHHSFTAQELHAIEVSVDLIGKAEAVPWVGYFVSELRKKL